MREGIEYKTRQRTLIEKALAESRGHITVDELTKVLSKSGENVGRTTVYRTLEKLYTEGKVRKYTGAIGESACYQYIAKDNTCSEHFHLKCEECGKLFHIECEHIATLSEHIRKNHKFSVNNLKTVLYGICEECAKK